MQYTFTTHVRILAETGEKELMMGDMSLITAYEQLHEASANGNHAVVMRTARHVLLYFPHIIKT